MRAEPGLYCADRAAVAQLARASACHAEGRGFESLQPLAEKALVIRGFFFGRRARTVVTRLALPLGATRVPSAPEDPGRVVVDLVEENAHVGGRGRLGVAMPSAVAVAPVQGPALISPDIAQPGDRTARPVRAEIGSPWRPAPDDRHCVAVNLGLDANVLARVRRDSLLAVGTIAATSSSGGPAIARGNQIGCRLGWSARDVACSTNPFWRPDPPLLGGSRQLSAAGQAGPPGRTTDRRRRAPKRGSAGTPWGLGAKETASLPRMILLTLDEVDAAEVCA